MATMQQIKEGMTDVWESLMDGWRRLYERAAGAITRFRPYQKFQSDEAARTLAVRSSGWGVLACEVYDDNDKVVVRLEAPGMDDKDFDVEVVDQYLVVRGEKKMESERTEGGYHISECAYGSFERAIPLPGEVQADRASARYSRGVLRVELPKSAASKKRKIAIAT